MAEVASCRGCQRETPSAQLNLSDAGQWLCPSCLAHYQVAIATRQARASEVYRRCTCGAVVGPADEIDVPMYNRHVDGHRHLNAEYMFRRSVYRCSCGREYRLRHPVLLLVSLSFMPFFVAAAVHEHRPERVAATALLGAALIIPFVGRDLYLRVRFPRVATPS